MEPLLHRAGIPIQPRARALGAPLRHDSKPRAEHQGRAIGLDLDGPSQWEYPARTAKSPQKSLGDSLLGSDRNGAR